MPPVEYRHEPVQQAMISDWPHDLLGAMCSGGGMQWSPEGQHAGCVVRDREVPDEFAMIYILAGLSLEQRECVIIHEKAHLNGWRHGPTWAAYQDADGSYRAAPGPRHRRVRP